jgi:hypothetical protein
MALPEFISLASYIRVDRAFSFPTGSQISEVICIRVIQRIKTEARTRLSQSNTYKSVTFTIQTRLKAQSLNSACQRTRR